MADDGAMVSLLAAVEAAAATSASSPRPSRLPVHSPTHSAMVNHAQPTTSASTQSFNYPKLTPLRHLRIAPSAPGAHSLPPPMQSIPSSRQQTIAVPPPPPLPPPLPAPPPLPPMSVRRRPHPVTTSANPMQSSPMQSTVTVHEASPPPPPFSEKRKGARIFTPDEKKILEANYARNKFPTRLHMQTLGRAMGKGTEKVRTWYNNRRALDRKMGVDVSRNPGDEPATTSPFSPYASQQPEEEPVVLPRCLIASPVAISNSSQAPAAKNPPAAPVAAVDGDGLVNVTPSAIAWAPSTSPVTRERGDTFSNVSPSSSQTSRFRMSPLRIRNGRLIIGTTEICGELAENPATDNGLEVKFLFGKKRIVYEWYCGRSFAEAQSTGGPYAKMEMNFSSVHNIQLFKRASTSVLQLSFSTAPTLFLQTQESIDKYKVRAQQRQYRKVRPQDFPVSVVSDVHRIWMRTDEAIRVSKILIEDTPRLEPVIRTWTQDQGVAKQGPSTAAFTTAENKADEVRASPGSTPASAVARRSGPSPIGSQGMPISASVPEMPRPNRSQQLDFPSQTPNMGLAPLAADVLRRQSASRQDAPVVRSNAAAGASANITAAPAPWQSPATPFASTGRTQHVEASMQWLSVGVTPNVNATPRTEHRNVEATPNAAHTVRRELNFNNVHRTSLHARTPLSPSRKRKFHQAGIGDENEKLSPTRRRIDPDASRNPLQAMQYGVPEHPHPSDMANANVEEQQIQTQASKPTGKVVSIINRLPR